MQLKKKNRNLLNLRAQLTSEKQKMKSTLSATQQKELITRIEEKTATKADKENKKMNKKVSFHLQERTEIKFTMKKKVRLKPPRQPPEMKKKNRQNFFNL